MQDKDLIKGLNIGADGQTRCWWCGADPLYMHYHDTEWGKPVTDDTRLFEKICLEGFQAGLSWITILRKRENFRQAFDGFNIYKVAKYTDGDIVALLGNSGIIRHRGKIEATINNANRAIELTEERGSLSDYFWSFKPPEATNPAQKSDIAGQTTASLALSKDLRKRGWKFVGPTTCYAFMQAMGMVNDHIKGCSFSGHP
jgi:DNA-3-methyladenine glycosylase I